LNNQINIKKPETADEERIGLFLKTAQNKKSNKFPDFRNGTPIVGYVLLS